MIDEFIEFMLTPMLAILFQVVLIMFNMFVLKERGEMYFPKIILMLITTVLIFPLVFGLVAQTVGIFTLILLSLCLFLFQIIYNIEKLLEERKHVRKTERYR